MSIPTEDEFNTLLSAVDADVSDEFAAGVSSLTDSLQTTGAIRYQALLELVSVSVDHVNEMRDFMSSLPAGEWFYKQPSSKAAWDNLYTRRGRVKWITSEQYKAQCADKIFDSTKILSKSEFLSKRGNYYKDLGEDRISTIIADYNDTASRMFRLKNRLYKEYTRSKNFILIGIAQCFMDYLYSDEYGNIAKIMSDIEVNLNNMLDAVEQLQSSASDISKNSGVLSVIGLSEAIRYQDKLPSRASSQFFEKIRKLKERNYPNLPISRNDRTASERWLIYNLWRLFRKNYHSDKSMAIWHLLNFEGIENPLELRTVERTIAKFRRK